MEAEAELHLARFRATYEPFLGGLSKHLMLPLAEWIPKDDGKIDNWMNNSRGGIARQLVEAIEPDPGSGKSFQISLGVLKRWRKRRATRPSYRA